jgi:hypothetical protein
MLTRLPKKSDFVKIINESRNLFGFEVFKLTCNGQPKSFYYYYGRGQVYFVDSETGELANLREVKFQAQLLQISTDQEGVKSNQIYFENQQIWISIQLKFIEDQHYSDDDLHPNDPASYS